MTRQMHLGVFTYPGGHHIAGWRHGSVVPGDILGYDYYRRTAEAAERGKFDLVFVGDMLAAREKDGRVIAQGALNNIDSISILSAVAGATKNVGLVATLSTTYNEPFAIAERFSSLDHISGGRAGWNIITTANDDAALNFSRKSHMEKTMRYQRAKEFVDICKGLWTAGKRVQSSPITQAARSSMPRRCTRSTTRGSSSRSKERSICRARRRAGRSWCRQAARRPGWSSLPPWPR